MERTLWKSQWWAHAQNHWFKLTIFGILCFIFLKKDLTFQLSVNAPLKVEETTGAFEVPTKTMEEKDETKSNLSQKKVTQAKSGILETIALPFRRKEAEKSSISPVYTGEIDEWSISSYIDRFNQVAIGEQRRFGIPASIILANGLVHSFAGQRDISVAHNNHFGLKCTADWDGKVVKQRGNCFRTYDSAWASFRDHSKYLNQSAFKRLKQYDLTDYKAWARGLEKLGYSNQPRLAGQLIEKVEQYKLYQYDLDGI